jgi:hypothetical protein
MKPTGLSEMERRVFGEQAVRLPDGTIQERGVGSAFHEEQIAAGLRREAACRDGTPATPPPAPPPPAPERFIDGRAVHPYPDRIQ